jgi:3-hydroxymyristoyl/3-hydroxydecanoyl-(acyl carrier protein) dehydratases
LIDKVTEYTQNETLTAIKNVTINEPFFEGHFPSFPVMPGVLILEAMAQSAAVLVAKSEDVKAKSNRVYLFASANNVKFKSPVVPGDQLVIKTQFNRRVRSLWKATAVVSVNDKVCSSADLMFTYKDL